jgi:hypothetical protein
VKIPENARWEIVADSFGLAAENAGDVEGVMHLMAKAAMGPEFKFEIVESTKDKCVGRRRSVPGTRGGRSRALTSILAAPGIKHGALELPKV